LSAKVRNRLRLTGKNGTQRHYICNHGSVFEVNRILGPGFLEKVYKNALLIELKTCGLKAIE
jgi:hypothetical protein